MFLKFQKNMKWYYVCFCHLHAANDSEWGWKRAPRFKCCPLALGSVPYTTATEWNWRKCKGMFTMFERKFHPHFFMSLNYQYECLFSSSLQVRRGCLVRPSEKCWIMRELHLVARKSPRSLTLAPQCRHIYHTF